MEMQNRNVLDYGDIRYIAALTDAAKDTLQKFKDLFSAREHDEMSEKDACNLQWSVYQMEQINQILDDLLERRAGKEEA